MKRKEAREIEREREINKGKWHTKRSVPVGIHNAVYVLA